MNDPENSTHPTTRPDWLMRDIHTESNLVFDVVRPTLIHAWQQMDHAAHVDNEGNFTQYDKADPDARDVAEILLDCIERLNSMDTTVRETY